MKFLKKMLLVNWHYVTYQVIEFNNVNFLTGKNASGKSTIIDALQVVLLGNPRGNFFNKAANDKAGRSLEGYLRGEIGDDGDTGYKYLRKDRFTSYIVCEFFDNVSRKSFCMGVAFDLYKDAKRDEQFFFLDNPLPENHFIDKENVPLPIKDLKIYLTKEYGNKKFEFYSSANQYRDALLGKLGGLNSKFFNLFKKAVTFTPIDDIEKFIVEYVCDVKDKIDITSMQENIRQYNNLAKQVEIMANREEELENIEKIFNKFSSESEKEYLQQYLIMNGQKVSDENYLEELNNKLEKNKKIKEQIIDNSVKLNQELETLKLEIDKLKDDRRNSDIAKKVDTIKQEMSRIELKIKEIFQIEKQNIINLRNNLLKWNAGLESFNKIKNIFESMELFEKFKTNIMYFETVTEENLINLDDNRLDETQKIIENIIEISNEKNVNIKNEITLLEKSIEELKQDIEKINKGITPYKTELLEFKKEIQSKLKEEFNEEIQINILADLLEIKNEEWQNAIEGYLNTQKEYLIIEPKYFESASKIYKKLAFENPKYHSFGIVDVEKINKDQIKVIENSLALEISTNNENAEIYIKYILGQVIKCETIEDLRNTKIGITKDCMLYKNYVLRKLNPNSYKYPVIGKKALEIQKNIKQKELEAQEKNILNNKFYQENLMNLLKISNFSSNEISGIKNDIIKLGDKSKLVENLASEKENLNSIDMFWLNNIDEKIEQSLIIQKDKEKQYEDNLVKKTNLENEIRRIEEEQVPNLTQKIQKKLEEIQLLYNNEWIENIGNIRFNKELLNKKAEIIAQNYINQIERTKHQKQLVFSELVEKRHEYTSKYQLMYNINEQNNQEFADELTKLRDIELPQYLEKIEDSRKKAYEQFREDFLAKLKSNIDNAKLQIKDLNQALEQHTFGVDKYVFKVSPKQEHRKIYEMVMDNMLMEGYNLGTEIFNQKYAEEIKELFDRITLVSNEITDARRYEEYEKNIKIYTDYRTYLNFDLIVIDKNGNEQRLSKTLSKKSGGETQTPFYISVLASFAQLYRVNNIKDNTFRLIVFDEAFSKMDSERIEESIKLLRKIGFQTIFAAPPEKLPDVQPLVDKTLCVLNPKQYSIVIKEYEKIEKNL